MEFGGIAVVDLSQQLFRSSDQIHALSIREGDDEYGLSNSSIRCLLKDSFGNVWAGSWGGGINFIKREPSLFSTYKYSPFPSTNNSLNSKIASGVCMDKAGSFGSWGCSRLFLHKKVRTIILPSSRTRLPAPYCF